MSYVRESCDVISLISTIVVMGGGRSCGGGAQN